MNRLVRGSIMFVAAAGAWACKTNLGENGDTTDHLVATPSVVLVANTDSQTVDVEAVNPEGQQLAADFALGTVGAGIVVRQDTSFLPVPGGHSPVRARFVARGATTTTFVSTNFSVTANGQSITIPVAITPDNLDIAFSNAAPALGEVVTLTAPTNVRFTPQTTVSFGAGVTLQNAVIAGLSADSTVLSLLLPPGITDKTGAVTNVVVTYLPGQVFDTLATTGALTTPSISSIPGTFSSAAPAIGDTVTLTLTAPYKALPNATVTFLNGAGIITGISVDSTQISFLPPPGATGSPTLSNVVLGFLTAVPLTLPSAAALTVSNTTNYVGSGTPATSPAVPIPALGDTTEFYDKFVGTDQFYKLVVPTGVTIAMQLSWPAGPDLDTWFCNAACSNPSVPGGFGAATGANPEGLAAVVFAAGTYNQQVDLYAGAAPQWIKIRLIRTQ